MPERNLSGKSYFPKGTIPSLEEDITVEVVWDSDDEMLYVLINGVQVYPEGD